MVTIALMRAKSLLLMAATLLLVLVQAVPAQAQLSGPCSETFRKYCSEVIPGDGRIMKCLDVHQEDQSLACKDWISEQQSLLRELSLSCRQEIAVLCRYDASNNVRIFQCLNDNYVGLKLDCRDKMRELKEKFQ